MKSCRGDRLGKVNVLTWWGHVCGETSLRVRVLLGKALKVAADTCTATRLLQRAQLVAIKPRILENLGPAAQPVRNLPLQL